MNIKRYFFLPLAGLLLLLVGLFLGWKISTNSGAQQGAMKMETGSAPSNKKKVLYWYDPMYPQQHFEEPGPSPFMDMDLVPRYADSGTDGNPLSAVRIDPAMVQNLGIRSVPVVSTTTSTSLQLSGLISFNDRTLTQLQSPSSAFIEQVWPLTNGDTVSTGQPLVRLRVPAWTGAQHELLAVLASGNDDLVNAGKQRLLSLGMPASLVSKIEQQREPVETWTINAPHDGVINKLNARPGMTLMAGETVATLQPLKPVWIEVAVPERQLSQINIGDHITAVLPGATPSQRDGTISEILPLVDPVSRTVTMRVTLPNSRGDLRPGMSTQVQVHGQTSVAQLTVPSNALLRTGQRTLVMVDDGNGRYRPQEVQEGTDLGDQTQIMAGLKVGEKVVVNGQFLLDSEANLQGIEVQPVHAETANSPAAQHNLHYAKGTIVELAGGKVKLRHGPFESLGMPGMTMRFSLANDQVAGGLHEGDQVRISVSDSDNGLVVESLEILEDTP